ncbi:hemicentin-1 [Paramormyrops kingsleyae]|uniref:hemicentin-1 n=1 Tax=Paramormyrops kingsleyae TaxID=1676925 RepID=UPI003B9783B3
MSSAWIKCCIFALWIWNNQVTGAPRAEEHPLPSESASTLAFVFDVTGSMYDDLKQVIDGASRILEKTLSRRARPIRNFVLVPFHDPDIGPVSITTDPRQFQHDLRELFVQGGGDCPEMSVGAIKRALEVSLPGSFIYVFTDARAKDYRLKRDVLQLVQLRQSQVVFVLTGDCGDRSHPGYRVYEEIAATSSGQIFHLDKQQVNEVLRWVEETVQAMKVHLLSSDHESAQENEWNVPFDPSLKEVTVSLSGPAPQIEMKDPFGRHVGEAHGLTELLSIPNSARVVNVKNPRPGIWTLKVGCSGRHTLRVTGVSNLDFRAGFSILPVSEFNHTRERPVQGVPAHVLLKCSGLSPPGLVSHTELVSASGRSLRTLPVPLPSDKGARGLWNVPEFHSPSERFFLRVSGKDADGYRFQRLSSVSYTNIIPGPPSVSMPSTITGFYMQPTVIGCSVESEVPYRLRITRSGVRIGEEKTFQSSDKASWEIPRVSGEDEGAYECVAESRVGRGRAETQLVVKDPLPVLKPPANVTSPRGARAVLVCQVEGATRYNMTWRRDGQRLGAAGTGRARVLRNSSLEIDPVGPQDVGEYQCVASNTQGQSRASVWLLVPEVPSVVVTPRRLAFSRGGDVRFVCTASGSPAPQVFWTYKNMFLMSRSRVSISKHGTLTIRAALPEDAGNYTCLASNEAGTANQTVTLSYEERPSITVARRVVLVVAGEDALLECQATGTPPPLVSWIKGDQQAALLPFAMQDGQRGTLRLPGVQEEHAGEYICVASSSAGTASATVTLEVGVAPQLFSIPHDVSVDVGENVTLPCSARGFPMPSVTWSRGDGRPVSRGPDGHAGALQLHSGGLLIHSAWIDDEGLYTCEAQNQFGSIRAEARVTITGLEPPVLARGASSLTTVIGQPLTIPCMLMDGIPLPERYWQHNGKQVQLSTRTYLKSDGSLHIDRVIPEDAGTYVCTAINVVGSANLSVTLDVHDPPEIRPGPLHYIANEGVAITLTCESGGWPKPTLVWTKGRDPLPSHTSLLHQGPEGQLHIPSPTAEDAGIYVCTASSPAGFASRETQLSVNTKPTLVGRSDHETTVKMAVEAGSEVILPCEAQGSPTPLVIWLRDGRPIPPVSAWFTVLPSGSLKISDVRLIDSKFYTCAAVNPAGNVSLTYNLRVQVKPRIEPVPSVVKALLGQTVTLPCAAQGEPFPEISWSRDGVALGQGEAHWIRSVTHKDGGTYHCEAENSAGKDTKEMVLQVLEAPSFVDTGAAVMETVAGSKVEIPCFAGGSPPPKIRWFKNGLEIRPDRTVADVSVSQNGSLMIAAVSASHSGDFRCVATNEAGSTERKTRLKVNVPPEMQEDMQPLNLTVTLQQPLTLACDAFGVPPPAITWAKDGRPVVDTPGVYLQNAKRLLRIFRVQAEHSGQFSCTAVNTAGEARRNYNIVVQAPPVISGSSGVQDLVVVVGQEVELQCRVSGHPVPRVEWSRDGEVLSRSGDPHVLFSEGGQVMRVKLARLRDHGQYQCLAINDAGTQSRQYRVNVQAPPTVRGSSERSEISVVLGFPAVLSCEVEGVPAPSLTWLKDGHPLVSGPRLTYEHEGQSLKLGVARADDAGIYTCRATNPAGTDSRHYTLTVLVPPKIEGSAGGSEAKVRVSGTLVLSCSSRGFPDPTTQWFRDGQPLGDHTPTGVRVEGHLLHIENAVRTHEGRYTCVVSNAAGEEKRDFHVTVQVPPIFHRVNNGPAAWGLGVEEEEWAEEGVEITERQEVVLGHPATLSCESNAIPPPHLTWYHQGRQLSTMDGVVLLPGGQVLQIPQVRKEHAGKYTCQAVNEAGEDRMHFQLEVLVPPVISGQSEEFVEEVGAVLNGSVSLQCEATGTPPPSVSWLRDGEPVEEGLRFRLLEAGRVLEVHDVQVADMASYLCLAENHAGTAEKLFSLTVQVPPTIIGSKEEQVSVIEGHMVSLLCDVQAYPPPEITWTRDGQLLAFSTGIHVLPGGQMLQLSRARLQDAGQYVCTATNAAGQDQKSIELSVYAPPTLKPRGNFESEVVTPQVGSNVLLRCEAQGTPEPEVTWYHNGLQMVPGGRLEIEGHLLQITGVQVSDSGMYICKVSNIAGQVDWSFRLTVHAPPVLEHPLEETLTHTVGSHVTLLCEATGVPAPSITWLKDGSSIESSVKWKWAIRGNRLELGPLQLSHAGIYTCVAKNIEGESRKEYRLTVQVAPTILDSGYASEISAPIGDKLSLECRATGIPTPQLTWLKDGEALDSVDIQHLRLSPDGGTLTLLTLRPEDSGTYTCLAVSAAGRESKVFTLSVTEPPSIEGMTETPQEVQASLDSMVTLECHAVGSPLPQISWLKNGRPLLLSPRTRLLSADKVLRISPVQLSDSGIYTCVARSQAGLAELSYNLLVQVPPLLAHMEPVEQVTVVQGSLVTLSCEARGMPPPSLSWLKDGQPLSLHRNLLLDGQETRLHLTAVASHDAGLYSCVASNAAGSSTKTFNLTVLEPPKISSGSPEEVSVPVNSLLELECVAEGVPPPTLSWLKDGLPLVDVDIVQGDGALLRITEVQVEDAGLYTCLASSPAGEDGRNHWVHVQVPPTLLGAGDFRTVTVVTKGHLTLECQPDSDSPPDIKWLKDDIQLQVTGRIRSLAGGQFLEIQDAQPQDGGHYSCVVSNTAGSTSLSFVVKILSPPLVKAGLSMVTAHVNQPAVLPCEAEGEPTPSVTWRKDGNPLPLEEGRFTSAAEGSLRIGATQASDAGRYYCVASNPAGSDHRGMDLRVFVGPSIGPGPFNVTMTTGMRAVLSCDTIGVPPPKVSWRRNGTPLDLTQQSGAYRLLSSGSLVILAPSDQDEGYFECTAANEVGEERRVIEVILQAPPSIVDDVTSVTVVTMSPVVLPCHALGRPKPSVSWTKGGAQLSSRGASYRVLPTGALEILAAVPSHTGRYTCSARNTAGAAHKHISLTVQEPPEIQPMAEEVQVLLHRGIALSCDVQGFPRPSITWQREGVPIATGSRLAVLPRGELHFSRVTLGDAGVYECLAKNEAGTATGRTRLVLQVPPVITAAHPEQVAVLGQPVSLRCQVEGQPTPEITWLRDRRPVAEGARLRMFANGTLWLAAVQRTDSGLYTCSASNPAGRGSADVRLIVHVPPMIPVGQSELSVIQGFQALLPCAAQGSPEPRVTWEKEGVALRAVPGKFTMLRSGELIIERAEPADAGMYTCVAVNTAGTARQQAHLHVNRRPAFKELPGDVTLNVGQRLSLSCHAQGTPTPAVMWMANNSPFPGPSVDEAGRSSLLIENVTLTDAGTYVCVAENSVGAIRALSFVRVREPPVLRGEAHTIQTVALGRLAMLDCPMRGDPMPTRRWSRDGRPLLNTLRLHSLHNGSLAIYGVLSDDSGEYRCVAESEAGSAERSISLRIQVPGVYSNWGQWGPCSATCGQGLQERTRLCNNPAPANGGAPCQGASTETKTCQSRLCPGEVPRRARGSLIGMVNEQEFGVAFLEANITEKNEQGSSILEGHIENVPTSVGPLLRVLVSVFAPIYWTTVLQMAATQNGFSLTQGLFRQESQLEFESGEILRLTHVARGLDAEGILLVDIVINGFVPRILSDLPISLQEFDESYVRTGPGQMYAWSSQSHLQGGAPFPLRCNHTMVYEEGPERQGPLLQLLRVSAISGAYSWTSLSLDFQLTASLILPDGEGESCPKGFVLDAASFCADEDECVSQAPCEHSCQNLMGGFSCACPSGFTISPVSHTCQDIDECDQGSHMCQYNQQCVNTEGGYRCQAQCGPGFKPSVAGTSCEDVDECQESSISPCQQKCLNTLGSFRCACHVGYQLSGSRCLDINECTRNVCPAHQQCRNTDGSYQCFDGCPAGMVQVEDGACVDVDECQDGSHMCRYSQVCQNTVGGYSCLCPRGYRSQGLGQPCLDINECLQVPSPCAHQCRNLPGSFRCLCPPGAALLADGRSCATLERGRVPSNGTRVLARLRPQLVSSLGQPVLTRLSILPEHQGGTLVTGRGCPLGYHSKEGACVDVDECQLWKPCQHECRNTLGSFQCLCPLGYQLLPNGRSCKDIDECTMQGIQCGPNQMCFNTRGGYQCLDTPCPASYQTRGAPGTCYRACSLDCSPGGAPLLLQYKLLTLPLGIPANHNVIRLSAFSEGGRLQERTTFTILEQGGGGEGGDEAIPVGGPQFGIRDEAGRGIIFTAQPLDSPGLVRLRVQATTFSAQGHITYQSVFIIYISISRYPY